jgi:hypothetical protein
VMFPEIVMLFESDAMFASPYACSAAGALPAARGGP